LAPARPEHGFRPDIEGLRAIAVVSVLIYHAGLVWTPGGYVGVDVFFVISGFLITSLMVREVERRGRLSLADFWARRARRLLPASALVLAFSAVVAYAWLPVTSRRDFGGDIVAAALYVVNWRLGSREVDYLAENVGASPVQHYWSLAVEEQFYIVWPLIVALVVLLVRSHRRLALSLVVGALSVASFVYTLSFAVEQPGLAFFFSTTRIWELGVGALLAIGYPTLLRVVPPLVRGLLGWAGLAAIVVAVLVLDATTVWPGPATLLPVLGTAAAILAGAPGAPTWGAHRLLSLSPAVWIGALSYSLYLWHWPFLVAAEGLWGDLRVRYALLVTLASVLPAWLSFRFVENPVRRAPRLARPRPALLAGAVLTAVSSVAGLALAASFALVPTVPVAAADEAPGARVLHDDPQAATTVWSEIDQVEGIRPSPLEAYEDRAPINADGCVVGTTDEDFLTCDFGDPDSEHTVVLVGDSKAAQWFTPVKRIAVRQGWHLVLIAKNGCSFADVVRLVDDKRNPSCEDWGPWAMSEIEDLRPDVVITTTRWPTALPEGGTSEEDYDQETMVQGLVTYWERVAATGAMVVPLLDTPGPPGGDVPGCVQEHQTELSACAYDLADRIHRSGADTARRAARLMPEARAVDMTEVVCPDDGRCPAVIGNVLVYRSGSHISDTFAATTTGALAAALGRATDGLFGTDADTPDR